jgi:radical SAM superfamily enzyme YgiQ (UPF0313 family)
MIGAALKASGHDVVIYCPQSAPVDWDDALGADLVGISTTTSAAPVGYEMSERFRAAGVPTVIGGPHVTFMPTRRWSTRTTSPAAKAATR